MDQGSMLQEIASGMAQVLLRSEEFIHTHPTETLQLILLSWLMLVGCVFLLIRQSRHLRLVSRRQQAEIERLQRRLEEVGPSLAAVHEEPKEAAVPVRAPTPEEVEPEAVLQSIPQPLEAAVSEYGDVAAGMEQREPSRIGRGLQKSRSGLLQRLSGFFSSRQRVDISALDNLEEILISSDVGARCAAELVEQARVVAEKQGEIVPSELTGILQEGIVATLVPIDREHRIYKPNISPLVVLVVGVNGAGKTTTVAKLAHRYMGQGKKVLAIAADTFRAAAVEQLAEWSGRVGFELVRGPEGAKPSGVVFDGMKVAQDGGFDVVLIDTAGRLHTKSNLMQELEGIRNVIRKHVPEGPHETVLVVDGVSGQNALSQAREFNAAVKLSGVVVTKLDGTPKGGIIVAISKELTVPVLYVGVGEKVDDLVPFDRVEFARGLFEGEEHIPGESHGYAGNA